MEILKLLGSRTPGPAEPVCHAQRGGHGGGGKSLVEERKNGLGGGRLSRLFSMVGGRRVELLTSAMSTQRSNQLS